MKRKEAGDIRVIGLSTHYMAVVKAAKDYPQIEIIHPIYKSTGNGIADGKAQYMLSEIESSHVCMHGLC